MQTRTLTDSLPSSGGPGSALAGELIGITSVKEECFS
jgi:hypothetical protein